MNYRCQNCLKEIEKNEKCPICNYIQKEQSEDSLTGKLLKDRYYVGKIFLEDSATRVYVAFDNTLNTKVFIREYDGRGILKEEDEFNFDMVTKSQAVDRFISYGKSLASIGICSLFPKTTDIFKLSTKGYIVTEYFEGENLKNLLGAGVKISKNNALKIAKDLSDGIQVLHRSHMIFGRICPETVFVLKGSGEVKLFGLGSPFFDSVSDFDLRVKHINPSYAPPELFSKNQRRGAFTDTYSIAAILYRLWTDEIPPVSFLRLKGDNILSPGKCNKDISKPQSNGILNALNVASDMRTSAPALLIQDMSKEKVKRVITLKLRLFGFMGRFFGGNNDGEDSSKKGAIILSVLAVLLIAIIAIVVVLLWPKDSDSGQSNSSNTSKTSSENGAYYGSEGAEGKDYNYSSFDDKSSENQGTVSLDPNPVCPEVVGKNIEQATDLLEANGFIVVIRGYEFSSEHAEDNVIRQSLTPGKRAKRGSTVELIISRGVKITYSTVPDVTGKEMGEAVAEIQKAGFTEIRFSFETEAPSGEAAGTVIEQNFKNETLEITAYIYLTVVGEEITVPDYAGKSLSEVDFEAFSITAKDEEGNIIDLQTVDKNAYTVLSQSLLAETKGYKGQKMSLTVKAN